MIHSPEVMRVWETKEEDESHAKCCACAKELHDNAPVMVVDELWLVCLPCVEWARPQMKALKAEESD